MPEPGRIALTGGSPKGAAVVLSMLLLLIGVAASLPGCALLQPLPEKIGLEDRLTSFPKGNLPLEELVRIHWNDYLIPFIEARTDSDLAFTLGMVQAHLRLFQMEVYRRASQGRLAQVLGPYLTDVDHSLRILNLGEAAQDIEKSLPPKSRLWLERFVEGINTYLERAKNLPHEFRMLGFKPEPWKITDVLTLGRLFGADVNWLSLAGLLQARTGPDWDKVWAAHLRAGEASLPSFQAGPQMVSALLAGLSKSGSNSIAISPQKTAAGSAILANDPHLGVMLPNLWLIAGYSSPSYHLVGLMVPGLPCVVLGRNPSLSWGGTNMRAASSDLYDISSLDKALLPQTVEKIQVRWWPDREIEIKRSPLGPVITDAPLLEDYSGPPLALRWVGHMVTDEVTAILAANRARDWDEFLAAWRTYGVSSQNILMADNKGNIGQLLAVALPQRSYADPPGLILDPKNPAHDWGKLKTAPDLPHVLNPESGFLISANNKPVRMNPKIGYSFSSNDRVRRLNQVLESARGIDLEFIRGLQLDVMWPSGLDLVKEIKAILGENQEDLAESCLWKAFASWDGRMKADSKGALAFELLAFHLSRQILENRYSTQARMYFSRFSGLIDLLSQELRQSDREEARRIVREALVAAREDFKDYDTWGDIHHLELSHFFGRIPIIGGRYRFGSHPVDGSLTTLMKTAHNLTNEPHTVFYGSQARHISDMSDPDENYFLLLGGQDGLLSSPQLIGMVPLWLKGEYVKVPLSLDKVRSGFPHKIDLKPGG